MNIRIERRKKWEEAELAKQMARGKVPTDDRWKGKYVEPEPLDATGLPDLPRGWCWASVEELGLIESGQTPDGLADHKPTAARGVPWFRVGDMNHPENTATMRFAEVWLSADEVRRFGLHVRPAGTIVFPKRGGAIATNKKRLLSQDSTYDLNTMGIVAVGAVQPYLWSWFQSVDLGSLNNGSTVPQINHGDIAPLPAPLPPLNEQRRIVTKLEALQARSRRAREALEAVPPLLEKLRQSILVSAFRGDLTRDWREQHPNAEPATELLKRLRLDRRKNWEDAELAKMKAKGKAPTDDNWKAKYEEPAPVDATGLPELPEGWCWAAWREVGFCQNGRAFPSKKYSEAGVKLLRPGNLDVSGGVDWTDDNTRFMPKSWADEYPDFLVRENELVMNLTAQSLKDEFLGRICLTSSDELCLLNQRLGRLTPVTVPTRYWLLFFKSPAFRRYVDTLNTGSLIQHMFTSQLDACAVPLMPLEEASTLVNAVDARLAAVRATVAIVEEQTRSLPRLERSVLAKAFRGELVPQDANDEPAEAMLARAKSANGPKGVPASTPAPRRSARATSGTQERQ